MSGLVTALRGELDRVSTGLGYGTGTVTGVDAPTSTVTLSWSGGVAAGVPYLTSYTPTVNDKVHFLVVKTAGLLVLGETATGTAPPGPGATRTAYLTASTSATWYQDLSGDQGTGVVAGTVRQGSSPLQAYVGFYAYTAGSVAIAGTETITRAELLLQRVDTGPAAVPASLHEYVTYDASGAPVVTAPEREFTSPDLTSVYQWVPIPVAWATDLATGAAVGLALRPNGALAAATYAEFASRTAVVDATVPANGGTIRLTITADA